MNDEDDLIIHSVSVLPQIISRRQFIIETVELAKYYDLDLECIFKAIRLAESFVESQDVYLCDWIGREDFMKQPAEKKYSFELAVVCICVVSKVIDVYILMSGLVFELKNRYLLKLEWEVLLSTKFAIPHHSLIDELMKIEYTLPDDDRKYFSLAMKLAVDYYNAPPEKVISSLLKMKT